MKNIDLSSGDGSAGGSVMDDGTTALRCMCGRSTVSKDTDGHLNFHSFHFTLLSLANMDIPIHPNERSERIQGGEKGSIQSNVC